MNPNHHHKYPGIFLNFPLNTRLIILAKMTAQSLLQSTVSIDRPKSVTQPLRAQVERQKRLARVSAINLRFNIDRLKRRVLVEPRRSGVVFQLLDLPLKIRVRHLANRIAHA